MTATLACSGPMEEKNESHSIAHGGSISVTQPSAWRSEYELRAGERTVGTIRWKRGRRSVAQADAVGIGPVRLTAKRGRVVIAGHSDPDVWIATAERERHDWEIHLATMPTFRWKKIRSDRWAVSTDDGLVLSIAAHQGAVSSSLLISVERPEPDAIVVLLCLIGAFLAVSEFRAAVDASTAVGAIVASGAG